MCCIWICTHLFHIFKVYFVNIAAVSYGPSVNTFFSFSKMGEGVILFHPCWTLILGNRTRSQSHAESDIHGRLDAGRLHLHDHTHFGPASSECLKMKRGGAFKTIDNLHEPWKPLNKRQRSFCTWKGKMRICMRVCMFLPKGNRN